jgi:hypothetical protein
MLNKPQYNVVDSRKPVPPPPPPPNGGWFTGEPFAKDAGWGTVPVIPDAGYMTHFNLRSAAPPPAALTQYPGHLRPGNNFQPMPGVQVAPGGQPYGLMCNTPEVPCNRVIKHGSRFAKYAYLAPARRAARAEEC